MATVVMLANAKRLSLDHCGGFAMHCRVLAPSNNITMGFFERWGKHAQPQCLLSDAVRTSVTQGPGYSGRQLPSHRILPYHAIPCHPTKKTETSVPALTGTSCKRTNRCTVEPAFALLYPALALQHGQTKARPITLLAGINNVALLAPLRSVQFSSESHLSGSIYAFWFDIPVVATHDARGCLVWTLYSFFIIMFKVQSETVGRLRQWCTLT